MESGSKVKAIKTITDIVETEYTYPIYLYDQCEDALDEYFKKVTKEGITEITFLFRGEVELKIKSNNLISLYEISSITTEEHWNEAVKDLEEYGIKLIQ